MCTLLCHAKLVPVLSINMSYDDISINWTAFPVPNAMFVYLIFPNPRNQDTSLTVPKGVLIRGNPTLLIIKRVRGNDVYTCTYMYIYTNHIMSTSID